MATSRAGNNTGTTRVFPPLLAEAGWQRIVTDHHLTDREAEVLLLLTSGYHDTDICDRLGIKHPTLRTHARSVYRKLECTSRVDVILALVHDYVVKSRT